MTPAELTDREEIKDAIYRWSRGVDIADFDVLRSSYTDDLHADFTELGLPVLGADEFLDMMKKSKDYFVNHHVLSNTVFHELTANMARTSTMVTATSIPVGGGAPFNTYGWYHDELRRTKDGWRIYRRKCQKVYDTNTVKDFTPPALVK